MPDNMLPLFQASYLKVERAQHHIGELEAALFQHAADNPPAFEFTEASEGKNAHIQVNAKRPPLVVGAIVGDAIHNLRAALDLMAVELVSLTAGGNTNRVYFPFCDDPAYLDTMIKEKNFHRAGQDAVGLVRTLKPYRGGNIALRALHDLDLQDKHHTLIANAAMMTTPEITVDASEFPKLSIKPVEGSVPSVKTVFPGDSPMAGNEIIPTLHELVKLTQGILKSFASLVAART